MKKQGSKKKTPVFTTRKTEITEGNRRFDNEGASEYLGITAGALAVGRCRGTFPIPYYKVGGKIVYFESDLDEYLASRRVVSEVA